MALIGAASLAERSPALVLINESDSLPRGLYVRHFGAEPVRGSVVATPQPGHVRRYLSRLGMPADVLLIKRVAATAGDMVCRREDMLVTPGREVRVHDRDRRGQELPSWTGCGRLGPQELFVLGDTPTSFDSRYFGPIRGLQTAGVYKAALTW
jgi:type IV secretory pathway protease TraF